MNSIHVPFLDLTGINARFEDEFAEAQSRVLKSGWLLRGAETRAFESEFGASNGLDHCVCVANGLDALRLVLRAWVSLGRINPGDEVVVPANSFIASALAVTEEGLRLRFADVDPSTFNVSADTVSAAITSRTRVVMPVHLYGRLSDVERIGALCKEKDLLMLEDAAQAHGARMGDSGSCTIGDARAFSFYPAKNLGALGDSGSVVTGDGALAERIRVLANYGSTAKYDHAYLGLNSRIDELQAAFLRIKLERLDQDNARRRDIAQRYCAAISHPLVRAPTLPSEPASHVWHLYVVASPRRGSLMRHLAVHGIETLIHYPRAIHRQPAYAHLADAKATLPVAEQLQHEVLSLPISPVMPDEQIDHLIAAVNCWPESTTEPAWRPEPAQ